MASALRWPILGVFVAVAITTAMDAGGLSAFSALPLLPLMALFWYLERLPRQSVGFARGRWSYYGLAALYPLAVLGVLVLVTVIAGAADLGHTDWKKTGLNFLLVAITTAVVVTVTEEGFFRGWLWASLERADLKQGQILAWSSIAFALWHWSAVSLPTGFDLPAKQIPVFMVNAAVIGATWGLLRWLSGSVIVSSVSHGLWNGGAYVLFGFGTKVGALSIKNTALYGPEVGVLGLALNLVFVAALWQWWKRRNARGGDKNSNLGPGRANISGTENHSGDQTRPEGTQA